MQHLPSLLRHIPSNDEITLLSAHLKVIRRVSPHAPTNNGRHTAPDEREEGSGLLKTLTGTSSSSPFLDFSESVIDHFRAYLLQNLEVYLLCCFPQGSFVLMKRSRFFGLLDTHPSISKLNTGVPLVLLFCPVLYR